MALPTEYPGSREDLAGTKWTIQSAQPMPDGRVRYWLRSDPDHREALIVTPDLYAMDAVQFWDAVDPRKPIEKLEDLVDSETSRGIEELFPLGSRAPDRYLAALNSHGTNGWTPLFRAVLLERSTRHIGALVLAGAEIDREQGWDAFPYTTWTPVSVVLARADEGRLAALLLNKDTESAVVAAVAAAAFFRDAELSHGSTGRLSSVVSASEAHKSARNRGDIKELTTDAINNPRQGTNRYGRTTMMLDLLKGWTPLVTALISRDVSTFPDELAKAGEDDLNDCERVLRLVGKLVPTVWEDVSTAVRTEEKKRGRDRGRGID